jgi:pimeloyl-ACP methyl ester carboxylesterase
MRRHAAIITGVVVLIVVLSGGFYAARNPETSSLDDTVRTAAPGKFIRLADGLTHYDITGPDTGRTVVLVHGFSVPYYIWDSTATALAKAGYRVVRYDEYGRGYSDRPALDYSADLYDRQLGQLLDSLHIAGPIDLAGVSMGGWVTGTFTGRHPARVRTLTLVDPVAGTSGPATGAMYWPVIGPYLFQTMAVPAMADGQSGDFVQPSRFPDWADRYRPQTHLRGFGRALLSTRRQMAGISMDSVYQTVGAGGVPTLLLWGVSDKTVPIARSAGVRKAIPAAEYHPIEGAGHLPIIEQAPVADSLLLDFLARHKG